MTKSKTNIIPIERVESKILIVRGERAMLDSDLAEIYGVETKVLNQAVKRNLRRFPEDFMFQLTESETKSLRSRFVTSDGKHPEFLVRSQFVTASKRNIRHAPYAFTEHGAVMLASILNSPSAVQASIFVVRAFIQLRQFGAINANLAIKIAALEDKYGKHDIQIQKVITILRKLLEPPIEPPEPEKPPIGFRV
jgi:hypothetical protein